MTVWTIASCAIVLLGSGIATVLLQLKTGYTTTGSAYLVVLAIATRVFSRARQAYRRNIRNTTTSPKK